MPDEVVIVSGGARGLGRALVQRLINDGWHVATFARKATDFLNQLPEGRTFWRELDATDTPKVKEFVADVLTRFGQVNGLVNNAAMIHEAPLLTTRTEDMEQVISTNLIAPMVLAKAAARAMLRNGDNGGAIVNISSVNAVRGFRGVSTYSAAKAGLDGYTRSAARELGPRNIRVNSVAPGWFDSDMTEHMSPAQRAAILRRTPIGRLTTTDDVVETVCFLLSPAAAAITGQLMVVDGGSTS